MLYLLVNLPDIGLSVAFTGAWVEKVPQHTGTCFLHIATVTIGVSDVTRAWRNGPSRKWCC